MEHMEFIEYITNKELIKATLQSHDHLMATDSDIIKGRIITKDFRLFSYNLSIPNDCSVIFCDICDKTSEDDSHSKELIDKMKIQGINMRCKDDDDGVKYSTLISIKEREDFDKAFFPIIKILTEVGPE